MSWGMDPHPFLVASQNIRGDPIQFPKICERNINTQRLKFEAGGDDIPPEKLW